MKSCPLSNLTSLIGKKWTFVILQEIELNGNKGFNSIYKRMNKISPKILSNRLKELEHNGLVQKKITKQKPFKSKYSLTEKGRELYNIMKIIQNWSIRYSNEKLDCSKRNCVECNLY